MTLPSGWTVVKLGEVGRWGSGGTPKAGERLFYGGDIPWIRSGDLPDGPIQRHEVTITEAGLSNSSAKWVEPGSVLIAMYGATIGKTGLTVYPLTTNQAVAFVTPHRGVNAKFLHALLQSRKDDFVSLGQGGAQPNISQEILKAQEIWLPPLAEQRRIVAKLDALTARIARARAELSRVAPQASRLRQEVLSYWFARGSAINGVATSLADLCSSVTDGDHQAPPKAATGVPFITISAMNDGKLCLEKATRFVPQSYVDGLKPTRRVRRGDVLYSVTGSIGIPAVVDTDAGFVFQRHIALLRPILGECEPRWLAYMLSAPQVFEQAMEVANGTAQLTIPISGLRRFRLPKLTLDEQVEIAGEIDATLARAERLEAETARARALLDRFEAALFTRAFRGELVPQDPADEPASRLLERIRAERAAAPETKRRRDRSSQAVPQAA